MDFRFWRGWRGRALSRGGPDSSLSETTAPQLPKSPFGRFIHSDDDARGHVALSLFLIQQFDENGDLTLTQFAEAIAKSQPATIQAVYFPAGQRMLEKSFKDLEDKEASREVQKSAIVAELTAAIEERHQYTTAQIDALSEKMKPSLLREIAKVTAATLIVTIVVVLLSVLPEPIGSLKEGVRHLLNEL